MFHVHASLWPPRTASLPRGAARGGRASRCALRPPLTCAAAATGGGTGGSGGVSVEGELALQLSLPRSFEELRAVRHTLELYRTNYGGRVAALLVAAYMFLQTFMLPGSMLINLLAGSLYPFWHALAFTAAVSTAGACANFWVGRWLLRDLVVNLFPARVAAFSMQVRGGDGQRQGGGDRGHGAGTLEEGAGRRSVGAARGGLAAAAGASREPEARPPPLGGRALRCAQITFAILSLARFFLINSSADYC